MAKTPESGGWGRFDVEGHKARLVEAVRSVVLGRSPTAQLYDVDSMLKFVQRRGGVTQSGVIGSAGFFDESLAHLRKESQNHTETLLGKNAEFDIHLDLNRIWRKAGIVDTFQAYGIQIDTASAMEMQVILKDAYVSGFESAVGVGDLLDQIIENVTTELLIYVDSYYKIHSEELRSIFRRLVAGAVSAGAQKRNSRRIL